MFVIIAMVCGLSGSPNPMIVEGCGVITSPRLFVTERQCWDAAMHMVQSIEEHKPEGSYVADLDCSQLQDNI